MSPSRDGTTDVRSGLADANPDDGAVASCRAEPRRDRVMARRTTVSFLGFSGGAPLGLALVAAALLGGIIVFALGSVRIVQLRKLARARGGRP